MQSAALDLPAKPSPPPPFWLKSATGAAQHATSLLQGSVSQSATAMASADTNLARRYGSKGVLEQWIAEVERDVGELKDTLSVGDIMDASLQR